MSGISYLKIVFGLKHYQRLYNCRNVIELVLSLRIIIAEHDAVADICERPGLHYHGIIEHGEDNKDVYDTVDLLKTYCAYFKIDHCDNPERFLAELVLPPKKIMIMEIAKSVNLKKYYSNISVAAVRLEPNDFEKEVFKREIMNFIISNILSRKTLDPAAIWKDMNECFFSRTDELETLVNLSIEVVRQKILDQSILELCGRFRRDSDNYLSIQESTELVLKWCQFQNINVAEFAMNFVNCLDKIDSYKNSLYFEGASESGVVDIIDSVVDACYFIGKIDRESTGYTYVWEECLGKRCIIMRDPIFDECMLEEVENIFRGTGTLVPHRQSTLKYLHRTPIILICSKTDKEKDLHFHRLQTTFLASYVNLKPFQKLNNRRLHPEWLNVFHKYFTENSINFTTSYCEDILEKSMDSDT